MSTQKKIAIYRTISDLERIRDGDFTDKAIIDRAIGLLNGYARMVGALDLFKTTLVTYFEHYSDIFGED